MSVTPHAILFGEDEMLNLTRRWILERAGYSVLLVRRAAEVQQISREPRVDLIVLCSTQTVQDCLQAIALAQAAWPAIQKLWLRRRDQTYPSSMEPDALLATDSPQELFLTVQRLAERLRQGDSID